MSIRLDPRRVSALKQLAGDAGLRPGDLVRQWVEERIDAARGRGAPPVAGGLAERVEELVARVEALEAASGVAATAPAAEGRQEAPAEQPAAAEGQPADLTQIGDEVAITVEPEAPEPESPAAAPRRTRRNAVTAAPSPGRVALHDEMIEVLRERGPMTAAELAGAIAERGRYAPPRSGKPLDAAMVSQRVSNPTYRSRFVRSDGRIGLAE